MLLEARFLVAGEPANPACLYATGVLLRVEPDGCFSAVCAGHPPPSTRDRHGAVLFYNLKKVRHCEDNVIPQINGWRPP